MSPADGKQFITLQWPPFLKSLKKDQPLLKNANFSNTVTIYPMGNQME